MARGTIKATVLIETILAAFEMDEILFELREHSRRTQLRALGLHLQLHQEVPEPRGLRAARPRLGHHGQALPEVLRRPAHQDLPPPRRTCHGRHGRADPDSRRPGSQRGGDGARARRQAARGARRARWHLGRASGPCPDRHGDLRRGDARAQPARGGARGRERHGGGPAAAAPRADHRGRPARLHPRRRAVSRGLAARQRLRAALPPDGGRGDRGDLPRAAVAVAAARCAHRGRASRSRSSASTG